MAITFLYTPTARPGGEKNAMKRRTFIESSIAAATVFAARPSWAAEDSHRVNPIGLQLYTVREVLKTDFDGTIAKVAATGYKEVEFAEDYGGHSPKDLRALLDKDGLVSPSAHIRYDLIEKKWPETLDAGHVIGYQYIVCPWIDEKQRNADGWKRVVELFNKAGEASQKAGIQLCYHNHSFEFSPVEGLDGKSAYEYLLTETDPKFVKMEMDLCWISVAGKDPVSYFDKYPGRFPMVHVKDYVNDPNATSSYAGATGSVVFKGRLADVGKGTIDFKRIFAESEKGGIKHYFVENDDAKKPFEDIKISYDYLSALRF
jgi:sugar phosphate isomerase/epimerase